MLEVVESLKTHVCLFPSRFNRLESSFNIVLAMKTGPSCSYLPRDIKWTLVGLANLAIVIHPLCSPFFCSQMACSLVEIDQEAHKQHKNAHRSVCVSPTKSGRD